MEECDHAINVHSRSSGSQAIRGKSSRSPNTQSIGRDSISLAPSKVSSLKLAWQLQQGSIPHTACCRRTPLFTKVKGTNSSVPVSWTGCVGQWCYIVISIGFFAFSGSDQGPIPCALLQYWQQYQEEFAINDKGTNQPPTVSAV